MGHRIDAFEAGSLLIEVRNRDRPPDYRLEAFFAQPGLMQPNCGWHDVDDYSLIVAFGGLPSSHRAVQAWFDVGVTFRQAAIGLVDDERDDLARAILIERVESSLSNAGVAPDDINQIMLRLRISNESRHHLDWVQEKLRQLGSNQDDCSSLPDARDELTVNIEEFQMGDRYSAGQVGAMGPGATASQISFQQVWIQNQENINLQALEEELGALRAKMKNEAVSADHDAAVGEVAAAEISARNGDGAGALEHLSKAGKWAFDVATKIGSGVATAALKSVLDL
ncbi:hypothetical protein [Cognatiyoonia sp. IB215182]|uniref:hypothetical protein n=1 Tax=Cognatiyoonia sp. IB215182 TaxID=3097353 RepID=UPI002A0EB296|nr:hypothetical protein [Cognatiyoonia sp. IB215182]MDX8353239.1 hypothetical protein [Cognatiyoonia sp. IB215182]